MSSFYKFLLLLLTLKLLLINSNTVKADETFDSWLISFKKNALTKGISQETIDIAFKDVKFLDVVIKYDRKQPEFFEDTNTYVSKRANSVRANKAKKLLKVNSNLFIDIENKFLVEKEVLLALWGIETNFGKHVGKMDIISSLATLSYDKRRRDFFSSQLLILLTLIEDNLIDSKTLYGSWAGAYGNFQFMPSTIKSYAIDYDGNNKIELKTSLEDSLESAAIYINKIGWKRDQPCFFKIELSEKIPMKFLNTSAKNIKNKKKLSYFKKYISNFDKLDVNKNLVAAIITPDKDIVEDTDNLRPAYLVFDNYELILKWNRSLRFALAVCTLKDKFSNEL